VSKVIELHNAVAVSYAQVAETLSEIAGKKVVFKTITKAEFEQILSGSLPEPMKPIAGYLASILSSVDKAAEVGEYHITNDFYELTGQQPETVQAYLKRVLKK